METLRIALIILGALLTVFGIYLFLIAPRLRRPEVLKRFIGRQFAHRGLHNADKGIPENTLAAFAKAADSGFGMEFDVRFSKDKQLVILHDESLERMTGVKARACDLTLEELGRLRIGGTNETLPRFEQVLELIDGRVPLIIELKVCGDDFAELADAVCRVLDGYKGDFVLESFDPRLVRWLKKNRPQLVRGQLLEFYHRHGDENVPPVLDFLIHNHLLNFLVRPDFIATYFFDRRGFSMRVSRLIFNTPQFDWTVRSQSEANDSERDGAGFIFEHFIPRKTKN